MSCQPSKLEFNKPDDSTRLRSILVSTPTEMTAMKMRPTTMAPWILSVMKDMRNPPRAKEMVRQTKDYQTVHRLTCIDSCHSTLHNNYWEPIESRQWIHNWLKSRELRYHVEEECDEPRHWTIHGELIIKSTESKRTLEDSNIKQL